MNKPAKTVLISLLVSVFVLLLAGCPNDIPEANEARQIVDESQRNEEKQIVKVPQRDKKIYSEATIEDDFDDSSVAVILDNFTGGVNKKHEESFFGNFEKEYVYDLSAITSDASSINEETFRQIFEIRLPKEKAGKENVLAAIRELEKIEGILYAGPSYYCYPAKVPNDMWYSTYQWALKGYGLGSIQAKDAWDITTGSRNVKVGIIDSGIANHPDLNANLVNGQDFTTNIPYGARISRTNSVDPDGHGTHVAGIVGAVGNNGYIGNNPNSDSGIAGVCWDVSLVPIKTDNWTTSSTLASVIQWAKNNNIKILNYSAILYEHAPELRQALYNFQDEILFITIAGNGTIVPLPNGKPAWDGVGREVTQQNPVFPACYTNDIWVGNTFYSGLPNLISVGSIGKADIISPFSNFSSLYVDIFAPGGWGDSNIPTWDILSTYPLAKCSQYSCPNPARHLAYGYHFMAGTSMAAPMVTGVAALMVSVNPTLTPSQIKQIILQNVDPSPIVCTSGGRLNAYKALLASVPPITISAIPGVTAPVTGGIPVSTITETSQYTGTVSWSPNHSVFQAGTAYTATITLISKTGYRLSGLPANFFTVAGASTSNAPNSGTVTAVFPETSRFPVTIAAIPGVTAPVFGSAPVSAITTTQYTGTVSWSPNHSVFQAATAYTATIALTPKTGYTLSGIPANFFRVPGAISTSNAANSGTVTAVFRPTATTVTINDMGMSVPVAGSTPESTITGTSQYTGTVSWSPNPSVFQANRTYTATIHLYPETGYSFYGVPANFFTVAGAVSTSNATNSGTVTAVFQSKVIYASFDIVIDGNVFDLARRTGPNRSIFSSIGTIGVFNLYTDGTCGITKPEEELIWYVLPFNPENESFFDALVWPSDITDFFETDGITAYVPLTVEFPMVDDVSNNCIYASYSMEIEITGNGINLLWSDDEVEVLMESISYVPMPILAVPVEGALY